MQPKTPLKQSSNKNYSALDGIRAYAAILVSLTHFVGAYGTGFRGMHMERLSYTTLATPLDGLFLWLFLNMHSVYILLTISGFMVCRMVMRPSYSGYWHFIAARGARIYPPLIFSLLFAAAIALLFSQAIDLSWRNILYNVLLLNGVFEIKGQPYNFPSWSLFYEIIYCLLIPGLLAICRGNKYPTRLLIVLWMLFFAGLAWLEFSGWILFGPFFAGSLLAQIDDSRISAIAQRIPTWGVVALYALVSSLPVSWAPLPSLDEHGIHFAPSYMVFIALACFMPCILIMKTVYSDGLLKSLFASWPLAYIGKISYSFYMLHAPLIFVAFTVFSPMLGRWSSIGGVPHFLALIAVFWGITLAAASFGFYAVEMLYFRSALSSRSKARLPAAPEALSPARN